jgi:hypothetical protein
METATSVHIVAVRRQDGWIAYPLGFAIEVVARGDTREEATAGARAAVEAAINEFGFGIARYAPLQAWGTEVSIS